MSKIENQILSRIKVLYVEDEEETREELHEFLKRRVGKVYVASDGEMGLELFEENMPDVVIADLFMPKMGGIDMVKAIRAKGYNPDVIIISAINDVNVILSAVDAGIQKYLVKPVDVKKLLDELNPMAEKIVSKRANDVYFSIDKKKIIEDEIKKSFAAFLKQFTGKGPKEVCVFLTETQIELLAKEILTTFEKSLLDNFQNYAIIKQNRDLFYDVKAEEILNSISQIVERKVEIAKTSIDVKKDTIKIIFNII